MTKPKGFAAMDPARQREISAKGGRRAAELCAGHRWDSEAAREASLKSAAKRAERSRTRKKQERVLAAMGDPRQEWLPNVKKPLLDENGYAVGVMEKDKS